MGFVVLKKLLFLETYILYRMACVNIIYFLQVTEIYYCRIRDIGGMEGWKLRVDDLQLTIIGWFRFCF